MQIYDSAERRVPVISQLQEIYKNRSLLRLLIVRDLTVRYKRSVLGVGWSLLNPILTTTVMFYVFNTVFMRGLQREKPYPPLTWQELTRDGLVLEREPAHRCCMAVVSSCREMLG